MATTHASIRKKLNRIIEIRRMILPRLDAEIEKLARKLGHGSFRTLEWPGLVVMVNNGGAGGYTTSWKDVANSLADRYNIPKHEIDSLARFHSTYKHPGRDYRVTVKRDPAKNLGRVRGVVV